MSEVTRRNAASAAHLHRAESRLAVNDNVHPREQSRRRGNDVTLHILQKQCMTKWGWRGCERCSRRRSNLVLLRRATEGLRGTQSGACLNNHVGPFADAELR